MPSRDQRIAGTRANVRIRVIYAVFDPQRLVVEFPPLKLGSSIPFRSSLSSNREQSRFDKLISRVKTKIFDLLRESYCIDQLIFRKCEKVNLTTLLNKVVFWQFSLSNKHIDNDFDAKSFFRINFIVYNFFLSIN